MFIEKRESRFTFDPGRGHTSYQSIVFYKHTNPSGFADTSIVMHDHTPCTVNRLKAQHTLAQWQRLGKRRNNEPMATHWENR